MTSINKVTTSWFAGTQETTLALASLNFNFSLVKVEAPAEFNGLGAALSTQRRTAAEDGPSHATARKLGALFEQLLPQTPSLIKAYGSRVSEIAQISSINPKGTKADGIFADQVGADGTSIWAAATSGRGAIAVHLLACMLARVWSGPEATSIWVEIVEERKKELVGLDAGETIYLPSIAAAQATLSRDQLANWDASARAWLRVADEAKKLKQKQLMLVIDNINIPVNNKPNVYSSVLYAWKSAMTMMDKLVDGKPQGIQDGAVFLGLSSWHLFPDMLVLGSPPKTVIQNDKLIAEGGCLTVGLQSPGAADGGVFWTLPLAYLRYYGDPVVSAGSISSSTSRVSMDQLLQVALGTIIGQWTQRGSTSFEAIDIICQLWDYVNAKGNAESSLNSKEREELAQPNWFRMLVRIARMVRNSKGIDRDLCKKLVDLGQRRAGFLSPPGPVFGLCRIPTLLNDILGEEEQRIAFLRFYALRVGLDAHSVVIRYWAHARGYQFATALPVAQDTKKRTHGGGRILSDCHKRWLHGESSSQSFQLLGNEESYQLELESIRINPSGSSFTWVNPPRLFSQSRRRSTRFEFLVGDIDNCALFCVAGSGIEVAGELDLNMLEEVLGSSLLPRQALFGYLKSTGRYNSLGPCIKSLRALATASDLYRLLPNATVSLDIVLKNISQSCWIPNTPLLLPGFGLFNLNRAEAFSCIALFETGTLELEPRILESVMAMCAGNSIYVASPLLRDPAHIPPAHEVKSITGNIGRPGITLLIPPHSPKVRKLSNDSWHLVNHENFNGSFEDCFHNTSLHLSFTEYTLPIDVGYHGGQDREACFLESLVSVHDRGEWFADLDVLGMFQHPRFARTSAWRCPHGVNGVRIPPSPLISIDSWIELLDPPREPALVRAHRSWIGRLAAAAISIQLGHLTVLFEDGDRVCWACGEDDVRDLMSHALHEEEVGVETWEPTTPVIFIC